MRYLFGFMCVCALGVPLVGCSDAEGGTGGGPPEEFFVEPSGTCPVFETEPSTDTEDFVGKPARVTFQIDGVARDVLLYMSPKAFEMDGPVLFSWHSTLPRPESAPRWIGEDELVSIEEQGGMVVAPYKGAHNALRPWYNLPLGPGEGDQDLRLMDEVVACARRDVGIDVKRIHAVGMSAGGQMTVHVGYRRSGYIASVVVYSGGLLESLPIQYEDNRYAAMIVHGGPSDISPIDGTDYMEASTAYRDDLVARGHFAFLCDHGGGHTVPEDSQSSAWQFMQNHPYGTAPSPYTNSLPVDFVGYCSHSKAQD